MTKILSYLIFIALSATSSTIHAGWIQKTNLPASGREEAVAFSVGNYGYVGTGEYFDGANLVRLSDFWQYDPVNDTWTQIADFGGGQRRNAVAFSIGNYGYVGTGWSSTYFKDFWRYDPDSNVWRQKANAGSAGRNHAVGFSLNGKGYIGLGYSSPNTKNDIWEYNPSANTWTQKANFTGGARQKAVAFVAGSKAYVGTGVNGSTKYNDLWEFNEATYTWTQKANFGGSPRYDAVAFSTGSFGYIATGNSVAARGDVWRYDPANDSWASVDSFLGTPRYGAVSFAVGSNGYISTGAASYFNDLWEYSEPTSTNALPGEKTIFINYDYTRKSIQVDASGFFTPSSVTDVKIFSVTGKLIQRKSASPDNRISFNLSCLHSGIYLIEVSDGKTIVLRKFFIP